MGFSFVLQFAGTCFYFLRARSIRGASYLDVSGETNTEERYLGELERFPTAWTELGIFNLYSHVDKMRLLRLAFSP